MTRTPNNLRSLLRNLLVTILSQISCSFLQEKFELTSFIQYRPPDENYSYSHHVTYKQVDKKRIEYDDHEVNEVQHSPQKKIRAYLLAYRKKKTTKAYTYSVRDNYQIPSAVTNSPPIIIQPEGEKYFTRFCDHITLYRMYVAYTNQV